MFSGAKMGSLQLFFFVGKHNVVPNKENRLVTILFSSVIHDVEQCRLTLWALMYPCRNITWTMVCRWMIWDEWHEIYSNWNKIGCNKQNEVEFSEIKCNNWTSLLISFRNPPNRLGQNVVRNEKRRKRQKVWL